MLRRSQVAALGLVVLAACGGGSSSPGPSAAPSTGAVPSGASVEITYPPEDGAPISTGDVLVALTVRGFGIVEQDAEAKDDEGHVVYYLDVDPIPTKGDVTHVRTGAGRAVSSSMTSHTWKDVAAGRHTLGVQVVTGGGEPLDPPETDTVAIVVGG